MRAKWVRFPCTSATRIKQNPGLYPRGFLFRKTLRRIDFYPLYPAHKMGKFTHFVYGMFWVIFQWEDANVPQYREYGNSYRDNWGVNNGLLRYENGYFWEVILDISV